MRQPDKNRVKNAMRHVEVAAKLLSYIKDENMDSGNEHYRNMTAASLHDAKLLLTQWIKRIDINE